MDDMSKMELYQKLVESKIIKHESGLTELPIKALREYHDAVGLKPEELCYFALDLPYAAAGYYNYLLGDSLDENATVLIMEAYYYDDEIDQSSILPYCSALEASIYRRFYNYEALVNGSLMIDQLGRLWFNAMTEDNIGAEFCVKFSEGSMGYSFYHDSLNYSLRVWSDGETVFFTPTKIFFYDGLPS